MNGRLDDEVYLSEFEKMFFQNGHWMQRLNKGMLNIGEIISLYMKTLFGAVMLDSSAALTIGKSLIQIVVTAFMTYDRAEEEHFFFVKECLLTENAQNDQMASTLRYVSFIWINKHTQNKKLIVDSIGYIMMDESVEDLSKVLEILTLVELLDEKEGTYVSIIDSKFLICKCVNQNLT